MCETEGGRSLQVSEYTLFLSRGSLAHSMEGEPPGAAAYATPGAGADGTRVDRMNTVLGMAATGWQSNYSAVRKWNFVEPHSLNVDVGSSGRCTPKCWENVDHFCQNFSAGLRPARHLSSI